MTVAGDARCKHLALTAARWSGLVAVALGLAIGVARAADKAAAPAGNAGSVEVNLGAIDQVQDKTAKTTQADAKPAKKKTAKSASKPKKTAKKPAKSTKTAKSKPAKPAMTAKAKPAVPTPVAKPKLAAPGEPAAAAKAEAKSGPTPHPDVATSLDKGTAELLPTGSTSARAKAEEPQLPPDDLDMATAQPAAKPLEPAPTVKAEPPATANAAPAPAEPRLAAAQPKQPVGVANSAVRIPFASGGADLPDSAGSPIGELAALMSRDATLRLQLLAYATGTKETASQSRRLSLNRALAVRGALIDAGVRSTRIDVRALGSQTDESPTDRVDILVMRRGG